MAVPPDALCRLPCLAAMLALIAVFASLCWAQQSLSLDQAQWRLLPDPETPWRDDRLFLPGEVRLAELAANPPTGGWSILDDAHRIPVTLPATVEQHFWGTFGFRRYQDEYYLETDDDQVKNGSYRGVSWWWCSVTVPREFAGKRVFLDVRAARLRVEVYWNRKLVGYHLIGETPFRCDVTSVVRPGEKNQLAIRITNPGGRFDWVDTKLWKWGAYEFQAGHGFGGLDAGLQLSAHDPVYIDALWVLNDPQPRKIHAHAELVNTTPHPFLGHIRYVADDPDDPNHIGPEVTQDVILAPHERRHVSTVLEDATGTLWDLDHPKLYSLRAELEGGANSPIASAGGPWKDASETTFGFRWFAVDGLGTNAVLRLNGKRIRLISAISWGFWGLNGLFPTPELARREVEAARALGLNCLQFHRNIGRTEVLEAGDRLGLLRYMEPGGGQTALGERYSFSAESPTGSIDTSGAHGDAETFAERYMEEKVLRMVRAHRGHPSLVIYCLQNEIHPDLENPRIFRLLRRIHAEDPSRIVILKSGIPPVNQAWMLPYSNDVLIDKGDGTSGWRDEHTVGGPGVWRDELYEDPEHFTHRSTVSGEIVAWGEMLGAAVPDNHTAMLRFIKERGDKSYDKADHEEQLEAYRLFLDRWGFRASFPRAENLFQQIGAKCYEFWGRVIETARLAEANDYLVISGWESTAIENHSGLVDNLRGFKSKPELLAQRLAPLRLAVKPRSLVWKPGDQALFDIFLINETGRSAAHWATIALEKPDGTNVDLGRLVIPDQTPDRFVYLLARGLRTPPQALASEGRYKLRATLSEGGLAETVEELLVVDPQESREFHARIGLVSRDEDLHRALAGYAGAEVESFRPEGEYDLIVAGCVARTGQKARAEREREIAGTQDDELFRTIEYGYAGDFDYVFEVPPGTARVTLRFAEMFAVQAGARVFDVAINGKVVLPEYDVFKAAGGKNIAHDEVIDVEAHDGIVRITVPRVVQGSARFCAIKVEAAGKVCAVNCGGAPYTDRQGLTWGPQPLAGPLTDAVFAKVRSGVPLLVWSEGSRAAIAYAESLAGAGAIRCRGEVGPVRASWMGAWFITRPHPVLEGLPAGGVMQADYQAPVTDANGVLLEGPGVDVFIAYGRDHDRRIGAAAYTAPLGRGRILSLNLPGLLTGLGPKSRGIHPLPVRRLLANALTWARGGG
ncbi:MAG: malectin domain-containing carbohydrate-binding protein [Planctomycetota bacterium]